MLVKGNSWLGGASEGMNVRLLGVTEGRENEETQVGGRSSLGHGVGGVAGIGTGCGKEGTAETGAESFAGGAGAVERNRAEIDHHCGGFAGGQVRLQTESGFEDISGGAVACHRVHVLLYGYGAGEKAAVYGRSQASRLED